MSHEPLMPNKKRDKLWKTFFAKKNRERGKEKKSYEFFPQEMIFYEVSLKFLKSSIRCDV